MNGYHLAEMSSELDMNKAFVASQFQKVAQNVSKALSKFDIPGLQKEESLFLKKMRLYVRQRCKKLISEAAEISRFTSV